MNQQMSRESRKIFDELEKLANMNGVQGFIPVHHILICDQIALKHNTQPIINVIKNKLSKLKNKEWKHFTIDYWQGMIHNAVPLRKDIIIDQVYDNVENFEYITTQYLITDYGLQDALLLNRIIGIYNLDDIKIACGIGRQASIYEIKYISAILEKEQAKKQVKIQEVIQLNNKIQKSQERLNNEMIVHSPIDVAMAEYNYTQKMKNAELIRKSMEIFR